MQYTILKLSLKQNDVFFWTSDRGRFGEDMSRQRLAFLYQNLNLAKDSVPTFLYFFCHGTKDWNRGPPPSCSNRLPWRATMERGGLPVCPGHVACNSTRTRHGILAVDAERGRREVPGAAAPGQCVQRTPNASMSVPRCRRWLAAAGAGVRLIWALSTRGQESARNEGRGGPARIRRAIAGAARVRAYD